MEPKRGGGNEGQERVYAVLFFSFRGHAEPLLFLIDDTARCGETGKKRRRADSREDVREVGVTIVKNEFVERLDRIARVERNSRQIVFGQESFRTNVRYKRFIGQVASFWPRRIDVAKGTRKDRTKQRRRYLGEAVIDSLICLSCDISFRSVFSVLIDACTTRSSSLAKKGLDREGDRKREIDKRGRKTERGRERKQCH